MKNCSLCFDSRKYIFAKIFKTFREFSHSRNFLLAKVSSLKVPPKGIYEEDVSYDVEALFTSIPIDMTIDYIIEEIYEEKISNRYVKNSSLSAFLNALLQGALFQQMGNLFAN